MWPQQVVSRRKTLVLRRYSCHTRKYIAALSCEYSVAGVGSALSRSRRVLTCAGLQVPGLLLLWMGLQMLQGIDPSSDPKFSSLFRGVEYCSLVICSWSACLRRSDTLA
eukprot:2240630-Rhodomonas_salina.1